MLSTVPDLIALLELSWVAQAISGGAWLFPILETLHVLSLSLVFGSIAMVDIRLLGWSFRDRHVAALERELLPWTWYAFAVAALSGSLLFSSAATRYLFMTPFIIKFCFLMAAGLNMLLFNLGVNRNVKYWGDRAEPPAAAKAAGGLSLVFWVGVVACGRWLGFV